MNYEVTNIVTPKRGKKKLGQLSKDPQNKTWIKDTSNFGFRMLERMGWSDGKGLGANLDGRTDYIKHTRNTEREGLGTTDDSRTHWNNNDLNQLFANLSAVHACGSNEDVNDVAEPAKKKTKETKEKQKKRDSSFCCASPFALPTDQRRIEFSRRWLTRHTYNEIGSSGKL
eukprot:TRINITY_DN6068_c0_g1_i1.p1 TRINITY_DN6068_c0_g1~~TRINITY_DN6068_c0_g1_i1.p1  ORF type:complete len:171 (+),score=18.83 TRINITY_DN6068_c0_g1_i1:84-596(+)